MFSFKWWHKRWNIDVLFPARTCLHGEGTNFSNYLRDHSPPTTTNECYTRLCRFYRVQSWRCIIYIQWHRFMDLFDGNDSGILSWLHCHSSRTSTDNRVHTLMTSNTHTEDTIFYSRLQCLRHRIGDSLVVPHVVIPSLLLVSSFSITPNETFYIQD